MLKLRQLTFLLPLCALFLMPRAHAQQSAPAQKTRILFVVDVSGSMSAQMDSEDRMTIAKRIMGKLIDSLRNVQNLELGLRLFGHTVPITRKDCSDTKLEVPFRPNNHKELITKLNAARPLGYTLIAKSLLEAANDFPADKSRNIIILITDGLEECDGDPCAVSEALQKKGVILRPFIIGIGANSAEFRAAYNCVGRFFNAENEQEFGKILGVIMNQVLNNTTCQINLLDVNGLPYETNVPVTIYDHASGAVVENWIHTMNGKGVPDTVYLDPVRKYDITVHTMPPVHKKDIEVIPGRHNTIGIPAPQGDMHLKIGGVTKYSQLSAIVRRNGEMQTINVQDFNTKKRYLTGTYDIEILTTPRIFQPGISIKQSQTFTIEIPGPGMLQLNVTRDVVAGIFRTVNNKTEWVCDIEPNRMGQVIIMQPGEYRVIGRYKAETRTVYTFEKPFKITTGAAVNMTL
jgi:Ca-activated chloride channel homolog